MINLRKFDKQDWDAFSSAESFGDGSDPLVGLVLISQDVEKAYGIVVDANGVHIYENDLDQYSTVEGMNGYAFLRRLSDTMTILDFMRACNDFDVRFYEP